MVGKDCSKMKKCKWFNQKPIYSTPTSVVQRQAADNAWTRKLISRAKSSNALAYDAVQRDPSFTIKEHLEEMRLFNRTPGDPYVRACLISRDYEDKERVREHMRTARAEYERMQSLNNDKERTKLCSYGRDFLGARRLIDPVSFNAYMYACVFMSVYV